MSTAIADASVLTVGISCDEDVVRVRHAVRAAAERAGLRLIDQTKLVTAASELARNALEHGGGGTAEVSALPAASGGRRGVRLVVEDGGPGIADVDRAMTDGFSGGAGMGMGLPGSRRLVDRFELWTQPGAGTRLTVEKWAS